MLPRAKVTHKPAVSIRGPRVVKFRRGVTKNPRQLSLPGMVKSKCSNGYLRERSQCPEFCRRRCAVNGDVMEAAGRNVARNIFKRPVRIVEGIFEIQLCTRKIYWPRNLYLGAADVSHAQPWSRRSRTPQHQVKTDIRGIEC